MLDLNTPGVATKIADKIKAEIDLYAQKTYDDGHRNHLGASLIGHECTRYLWYIFRWASHEKFSGRMQRLFQRGHLEEFRYVEYWKGIGGQVWTHDESQPQKADGTFPQYRVSGVMGHFGGSLDAIVKFPADWDIPDTCLGEFKTKGTGAGFNKLATHKLPVAAPQHFAQTSIYGFKGVYGQQFNHVVYFNTNKNDDDMYVEVAKLDHRLGEQMEQRAERIITSQTPPLRISDNPTFWQCKTCAMRDVCHLGSPPEINCRSCKFAKPVENGEWFCEQHNGVIPKDFIPQGCGNHKAITVNAR